MTETEQETMFDVPEKMRRSKARGEPLAKRMDTAVERLDKVRELAGLASLADVRFLDIGCGDRFTTVLVNRDIPIAAYHGVDVREDIVAYFREHVRLPNFTYEHIDVHNEMYNRDGEPLRADTDIGASGRKFEIVGLFSVFTHLAPEDWQPMLGIARRHVADDGHLVFTAFVEEDQQEDFIDRYPDRPLLNAVVSRAAFERHIAATGWRLKHFGEAKFLGSRWICCSPGPSSANPGGDA